MYHPPYFADQDWKDPDRKSYMAALARHRPAVATVLDWERFGQLAEVLDWAEEAAAHVTEAVLIVPKVVGRVHYLPREVGGKRVVLAYSVPTAYGGTRCDWTEFRGWPVHLLGGSPQKQIEMYHYLRGHSEVVSADGNMAHQQAHRCRTWTRAKTAKGHWQQLSDVGDRRVGRANLEAFRRSLVEIRKAWELAAWLAGSSSGSRGTSPTAPPC